MKPVRYSLILGYYDNSISLIKKSDRYRYSYIDNDIVVNFNSPSVTIEVSCRVTTAIVQALSQSIKRKKMEIARENRKLKKAGRLA